jgi:hypothetical protein
MPPVRPPANLACCAVITLRTASGRLSLALAAMATRAAIATLSASANDMLCAAAGAALRAVAMVNGTWDWT